MLGGGRNMWGRNGVVKALVGGVFGCEGVSKVMWRGGVQPASQQGSQVGGWWNQGDEGCGKYVSSATIRGVPVSAEHDPSSPFIPD
jgi:hypothetical protein